MANTIWKYKLDATTILAMPIGASILTVQIQNSQLCLWALVNPTIQSVEREFHVFPTGGSGPPSDWPYIGTVQDGELVWHLFESV